MEQALAPPFVVEDQERSHVDKVRRSKKGKVTAYHHVVFGWVKPQSLYFLEKLHQLWPGTVATTNKLMEGGYRFKEAVISSSVNVFGLGLPVGWGLYTWAAMNTFNNIQAAAQLTQAADAIDAYVVLHPELGQDHWDVSGRVWLPGLTGQAQVARQAVQGRYLEAVKWGGAMALPYGDLWLIYKVIEDWSTKAGDVAGYIQEQQKLLLQGNVVGLFANASLPLIKIICPWLF
jgi:hypothetical protein